MVNLHSDTHLCPVCFEKWVYGLRIYCSPECKRISNAYTGRLDYHLKILSELGFKITRSSGVFFDIDIPSDLAGFYPQFNRKISFPAPGQAIDCLNGESLMLTIEGFIGKGPAKLIRDIASGKYDLELNAREFFHSQTANHWIDAYQSAACPRCARVHIPTEQGWDPVDDCCTDCSIAAIPF